MSIEKMRNKGIKEAVELIRREGRYAPDGIDETIICFVLDLYLATMRPSKRYVTPTFVFEDKEPTIEDVEKFCKEKGWEAIVNDGKLIGFQKENVL